MQATIGVLGGGQLGRMLTLEAKRMGHRVVTLEPFPDSPCGQVADEQIVAAYGDLRAIGELGARSDVVTFEFENIPLAAIRALEQAGRIVRPGAEVLRLTQDRRLEKGFIRDLNIATAPFAAIASADDLIAALDGIGLPGVIKTALGGYDGKGQSILRTAAEAQAALDEAGGQPLIYERFVAFEREVSVICARNVSGEMIAFPVSENVHDHGVLETTIVPARISSVLAARVGALARTIGERLGMVGVYCVEFFVAGDDVYVNEIAPRVHNSGHYSLDAMHVSQYEAHVRAICDLPLAEPQQFAPVVMMNILGTGDGDELTGIHELLRDPAVKLHLYGKTHAALRRKMGHFTVLAPTLEEALVRARCGREKLGWSRREALAVAGRA